MFNIGSQLNETLLIIGGIKSTINEKLFVALFSARSETFNVIVFEPCNKADKCDGGIIKLALLSMIVLE